MAVAGSLDNFIGMDGSVVEFNSFDRSSFRRAQKIIAIFLNNRNHLAEYICRPTVCHMIRMPGEQLP